jgi:S1-C subfamily serine protease
MNKHKILFSTLVSFGAVLTLALVATLAFAGGLALSPHLQADAQAANGEGTIEVAPSEQGEPVLESEEILAAFEQALIHVYETTLPSVVDIQVTQRVTLGTSNRSGGFFRQGEGSGFVWDEAGHIVTNYHVVEDAEAVKVIFADGSGAEAEVIAADPNADVAVLKVDLPVSKLQPLTLGDSDALQVGQLTIAIGNPYGQGYSQFTIPRDVHTQKNRDSVSVGSLA